MRLAALEAQRKVAEALLREGNKKAAIEQFKEATDGHKALARDARAATKKAKQAASRRKRVIKDLQKLKRR